ncbi:MAG: hypothetical protein R3C53_12455 [Pirellulaceae bacterium]
MLKSPIRVTGNRLLYAIARIVMFACILLSLESYAQDKIELVNGTNLTGTITKIDKSNKQFEFETQIGTQRIQRTYPYDQVHAATYKGKRFVITPKHDASADATSAASQTTKEGTPRSSAEILALIDQVGKTPPDWFTSTPANHPKSLDLDWPLKADGPWDENKNVGQYIWGRVNPNVSRWKSGIILVHQCLERHQDDPALRQRDMEKLGVMYFTLLQDYARAAYWLQQANVAVNQRPGINLAECYWRLGNRDMALKQMRGKSLHFDAIKLLGDMGEIEEALNVTKYYAKTNASNEAYKRCTRMLCEPPAVWMKPSTTTIKSSLLRHAIKSTNSVITAARRLDRSHSLVRQGGRRPRGQTANTRHLALVTTVHSK